MLYILVIMMSGYLNSSPTVAVTSIEFNTKEACESARTTLKVLRTPDTSMQCVSKGHEQ